MDDSIQLLLLTFDIFDIKNYIIYVGLVIYTQQYKWN